MKLQRIDKEMHCIRFSGMQIHDKDTGELLDITYEVHDAHVYAAFGHVLCLIEEAELFAHKISNEDVCKAQLHEVGKRRAAFMLVMMKIIKDEVSTKFK
jgi:hypothetical protein